MKKIIMFLLCILLVGATYANTYDNILPVKETTTSEKWIEVESVVIPFGLEVNKGVTTKGNPKYWFVFKEIGTVSLSANNYKKYMDKTDYIELVKWQKGNKYKYTTRLKGKANITLSNLFK